MAPRSGVVGRPQSKCPISVARSERFELPTLRFEV
jgi:hypothetical protein